MGLAPSGFFVLRTPFLPASAWPLLTTDWSAGSIEERRAAMRALVADPCVREAIFVGSPDLDESIDAWLADADSPNAERLERAARVERAVSRYLARMAWRPTPFGLFAGVSVGTLGPRTRVALTARGSYRRRTRLDGAYLDALVHALAQDRALRATLSYRPNTSLYAAGGRMRYIEARAGDSKESKESPDGDDAARHGERARSYSLADVADTRYLRAALARARDGDGATISELTDEIMSLAKGVTATAAARFVEELIDNQLLIPVLPLPITGEEPLALLADTLRRHPAGAAAAERLSETHRDLTALDGAGLAGETARYRAIARSLAALPAPAELRRLFQVDLFKPVNEAVLGAAVVSEIARGAELLHRLQRGPPDPLTSFRQRFVDRYEQRAVPLTLALDDESGIGLDAASDPEPLLRGLVLDDEKDHADVPWGRREELLLAKLTAVLAAGGRELVLEQDDVEALAAAVKPAAPPLSPGTSAIAVIAAPSSEAIDRGEFLVHVSGVSGASGMELLGRFCHGDAELSRQVMAHLRREEVAEPDAVYAEIVHSPAGRVGNILNRPALREHEIVYLGDSGAARGRQIEVDQLLLGVEGERLVLRRAADGRRVIPRLTTAHNWRYGATLATYRFLCMLQMQGTTAGAAWDWGPLASAPFVPRVRNGRVVLSLARWRARVDEVRPFFKLRGEAVVGAVRGWRERRDIPRHVALVESDNVLPIDLDAAVGAEALVRAARSSHSSFGETAITLQELFPSPDELWVRGPEGCFTHEIILPFIASGAERATAKRQPPSAQRQAPSANRPAPIARAFAPGSEWLYAKLYTGPATLDRVVRRVVGPLVRQARQAEWIDRWFFIRYGDPAWHIRVRFHGEPAVLRERVLPALHDAAALLVADASSWRMDLGTYEREVERYGGHAGIELAERLFEADSDCVLEILEHAPELGRDDRWRVALCGIDRLLGDLGFDPPGKLALSARLRDDYVAEHRPPAGLRRQLGDRFRGERSKLEALFAGDMSRSPAPMRRALEALDRRSGCLVPIVRELRALDDARALTLPLERIAPSFAHMFANRLLRFAARDQELVLYDFLSRLYEARAARDGVKPGAGAPRLAVGEPAPEPRA